MSALDPHRAHRDRYGRSPGRDWPNMRSKLQPFATGRPILLGQSGAARQLNDSARVAPGFAPSHPSPSEECVDERRDRRPLREHDQCSETYPHDNDRSGQILSSHAGSATNRRGTRPWRRSPKVTDERAARCANDDSWLTHYIARLPRIVHGSNRDSAPTAASKSPNSIARHSLRSMISPTV